MRRKAWALVAAAVLVVATTGGMIVMSSAEQATAVARDTPANTAKVEQGPLSAMVSQDGTLTYRARPDGSPYTVVNQARGVYTRLPETGDEVACGAVLYRVDDEPVLLLCGAVPAYRDLQIGEKGNDVRQLNRNLRELGYDADAGVKIDPGDHEFTWQTAKALEVLQHDKGFDVTGDLDVDDAVFLPKPARIAKVTGKLGGFARPGGPVLDATSGRLHVQVALDPSEQGQVEKGDRAQITLPGNTPVSGRVEGFGSVAQVSAGRDSSPPTRPSRPTSASTTQPRHAGSTGPRSVWTSRPRA